MKIKTIKKLKNGKYKLELENKEQITTYDSVILENNLLFNPNVDLELLNKINNDNNYYDIYNKVIKMVSNKLRSEKEIREFLVKNELSDIDKLIVELKNNKIIDDEKFVKAFIHDKVTFTNYGPFKIRDELLKHDIPDKIIDRELSYIDNNLFDDKVKKIVSKKISTNHKYSNNILKKKILDELYNLGYKDYNLDEFDLNDDDNILKKEISKLYEKFCYGKHNEQA